MLFITTQHLKYLNRLNTNRQNTILSLTTSSRSPSAASMGIMTLNGENFFFIELFKPF